MNDKAIELNINGETFLSTRENTTLFTFFGALALYNHVFLEMSEPEAEVPSGAYIFCDHPVFGALAGFIAENEFPMVLNRTDVPECDLNAWDNGHINDLKETDTFPQEWTSNE